MWSDASRQPTRSENDSLCDVAEMLGWLADPDHLRWVCERTGQRFQDGDTRPDGRLLHVVRRRVTEAKSRRESAALAMLIGQAKRFGGTGNVQQQRMRCGDE